MRLSLILLATTVLTLLARSTDAMTDQRLMTLSDGTETIDRKVLRVQSTVEEVDSKDSEEERGLNKFPTLDKLKSLREVERIKEIKEALTLAKENVKAAAEAAAKAAKAKQVEAIAAQLDDAMVKKILQDPDIKNAVFNAWYKGKLDHQLVFDSFALPGKYTKAKWDGIGIAYLDFKTDMAKAAAGLS